MFGVLASLAPKETAIGVAVFLLTILFIRKTSLGTLLLLLTVSLALLIERSEISQVLLPLCILALQYIKRFQVRITNPNSSYKNEAFEDLKRKK
jgi:glycerol-3-phosphate acyltransferase PlsY